jgi:hypothetical protein
MLARRSIQKLLNESGGFLMPAQLERLVARLNARNRDTVEAEWELIVLAAFASIGAIEHEADLGGSTRLDLRFRSLVLGRFVADIRTVSDETYNRENAVHEFSGELTRISAELRREGIQGGLDYRVNGVSASPRQGRYKTKLTLPFSHEFKRVIFNKDFGAFLDAIRAEPNQSREFQVNNEEASVSITFSPRAGGFSFGSHLSYNQAHDAVHNVVWQALKHKSAQIKHAGKRATGELAGVILCDGTCGLLRTLRNAYALTVDDVISQFLRKSRTVDFVSVLDIAESTAYGQAPPPRFEARTWSIREKAWAEMLSASLNLALQRLPSPRDSALNTVNQFNWSGDRQHLWGRYMRNSTMTHNSLEVSLRAAMDYLAGRTDRNSFERIVHPDWLAHLKEWLDQGRSVESVSIREHPGEDDDGLLIRFAEHDPAASPFRVPRSGG